MARKTAANKSHFMPLEARPEFLAVLAALPAATEVEALEQLAADSMALFNDAIRGNAPEQAALAKLRYDAVAYRLHGDSFMGCAVDDGSLVRLERQLAAVPGAVPSWGQGGEWLVEVNGMRIRAKVGHGPHGTIPLDLLAVDLDRPFLSPTGYRSHWIHYDQWFGRDLAGAVRAELERCLQEKDWQPVPIEDKDKPWVEAMPAWLAPALEGVTHNGQQALPLSGLPQTVAVAAAAVEKKVPMDNAERQRRHRQRQKEKRELAKAEGRRTFELSDVDLSYLWLAMNTHIAFNEPLDWELQGFRELAGRLYAHEHPSRIERLGLEAEGVNNLQARRDKDAKRGWDAYKQERKRVDSLVDKVNNLQAENAHFKQELAAIAAELGGAPMTPAAPAVDVAALQAELARVRAECELLEQERCKAFAAIKVFEDRLRAQGLSTDCRPQPVE